MPKKQRCFCSFLKIPNTGIPVQRLKKYRITVFCKPYLWRLSNERRLRGTVWRGRNLLKCMVFIQIMGLPLRKSSRQKMFGKILTKVGFEMTDWNPSSIMSQINEWVHKNGNVDFKLFKSLTFRESGVGL